jgi:hypothetical protein
LQVESGVECAGGVAEFLIALDQIMFKRIDLGRPNVGVLLQIILHVELGDRTNST